MRFQDKVALVTGAGAGGAGLGAAIARMFAGEGARVVVADIRDADGEAVAAEIRAAGGQAMFLHLDVTREADWAAGVETIVKAYGRLDVLVSNAYAITFDAELFDMEAWDRVMTINTRGPFLGMKFCAPQIAKAGGGAIVHIASISGYVGQAFHMSYNASKGAVRIMTKSGAVQLAKDGIRVNAVAPGLIVPKAVDESKAASDPAIAARLARNAELDRISKAIIPLQRAGRTDEIAKAVLFLASDDASYITGAELIVDGGRLAKG